MATRKRETKAVTAIANSASSKTGGVDKLPATEEAPHPAAHNEPEPTRGDASLMLVQEQGDQSALMPAGQSPIFESEALPAERNGKIILPLRRNGVFYKVGDPVILPDKEFRQLESAGVVGPADAK